MKAFLIVLVATFLFCSVASAEPTNTATSSTTNAATRDYVTAEVEKAKSHYVTVLFSGTGLLIAIFVSLLVYFHNDTKQSLHEAKNELKALIERLERRLSTRK